MTIVCGKFQELFKHRIFICVDSQLMKTKSERTFTLFWGVAVW